MIIGAQLYVFSKIKEDSVMVPVLESLANAGYEAVETMNGLPPQKRAILDQLNLPAYALHIALCVMSSMDDLLRQADSLGTQTICVSGLLDWYARTETDYLRSAEALNTWGRDLAEYGIALHYHNHDFEFMPMENGDMGMDLLLQNLDVDYVSLCCDAGWIAYAGCDPAPFLKANADRIGTLHLRDFNGKQSVHLGAGTIDPSVVVNLLPILPKLKALNIEQDPTTPTPLEDMVASRSWLREQFDL